MSRQLNTAFHRVPCRHSAIDQKAALSIRSPISRCSVHPTRHAPTMTTRWWRRRRRCRSAIGSAPGDFPGTGPIAVARRLTVLLHDTPLRQAAVDHPRRRARPRRDGPLADRLGVRDGDRGCVHHHVAPGRRSQRAPSDNLPGWLRRDTFRWSAGRWSAGCVKPVQRDPGDRLTWDTGRSRSASAIRI